MSEQQYNSRQKQGYKEEIDLLLVLGDMWQGFLRFGWIAMLVFAVAGAGIAVLYTAVSYSPLYKASSTFAIQASTGLSSLDGSINDYFRTLNTVQKNNLFLSVMDSDIMYYNLERDTGIDIETVNISAEIVADTNMVTVQVEHADPENAMTVLESIMEQYPQLVRHSLGSIQLSVLKQATVSEKPVNTPSYPITIAKGMAVGFLLALVILFLYAVMRSVIREEDDFRNVLNQKCLGILPLIKFKKIRGNVRSDVSILNPRVDVAFRESVRALRTHVLKELDANPHDRVLLVTSTMPDEGKTTVAINLALSLAQNGASVILVDTDLRNQSLKQTLNMSEKSVGLAGVLRQQVTVEQALLQYKDTNLRLLAGDDDDEDVLQSLQKLNSKQIAEVIAKLRTMADYVILDCAPCGVMSDAISLAQYADCALYVVKQNYATTGRIFAGLDQLAISNIRILGCVFNAVASGLSGYGYGYGNSGRYGRYGRYGTYGEENMR